MLYQYYKPNPIYMSKLYLCKNNVVIDNEIANKIKMTFAHNIAKEFRDNLKKSQVSVNVKSIIRSLPIDTFIEQNNSNKRKV